MIEQGLGEDLTARHTHLSGQFDGVVPQPVTVGSADCIANGDSIDDAADVSKLFNGFPEACYLAPPQVNPPQIPPGIKAPDFERGSAFLRCTVMLFWATAIRKLYAGDVDGLGDQLAAFFPAPSTVNTHAAFLRFPALATIINPEFAIACVSGTTNFQQFATQAFTSISGPHNVGIFATLPLWYDAGEFILFWLKHDGWDVTKPLFLVGHSYGAVAALTLVARIKHFQPNFDVRYLTFGTPKIGDDRMVRLVAAAQGQSVINAEDFVGSLPPNQFWLGQFLNIVPGFADEAWSPWQPVPRIAQLNQDGTLVAGADGADLDFATLQAMILRALTGFPQNPIAAHSIDEYVARLKRQCEPARKVDWPLTPVIVSDMIGPEAMVMWGGAYETPAGTGAIEFGGETVSPHGRGGISFGGS